MSMVTFGILLFVLACFGNWAQDALAPYVNQGEAAMPGPITFQAEDAKYRVVTSGPFRPAINRTGCTITRADGEVMTESGMEGIDGGTDRFGVTRVFEFDAVAGPTEIRCGNDYGASAPGGRFQIVAARGPVTYAIWTAFLAQRRPHRRRCRMVPRPPQAQRVEARLTNGDRVVGRRR